MNKILKRLKAGDKIKVFFADQNQPAEYFIFYVGVDEVFLMEPQKVYASKKDVVGNKIIFGSTAKFNGIKFSTGDQLMVTTKSGQTFPMYISYFFDKDGLTLNYKKLSKENSFKSILRMMSKT